MTEGKVFSFGRGKLNGLARELAKRSEFCIETSTGSVVLLSRPEWFDSTRGVEEEEEDAVYPRFFTIRDAGVFIKMMNYSEQEIPPSLVVEAVLYASILKAHKSHVNLIDAAWNSLPAWDGESRLHLVAESIGIDESKAQGIARWFLTSVRRGLGLSRVDEVLCVETKFAYETARSILQFVPDASVMDAALECGPDLDLRSSAWRKSSLARTMVVLSDAASISPKTIEGFVSVVKRDGDDRECEGDLLPPKLRSRRRCGIAIVSSDPKEFSSNLYRSVRATSKPRMLDRGLVQQILAEAAALMRVDTAEAYLAEEYRDEDGSEDPWDGLVKMFLDQRRDEILSAGYVSSSWILKKCLGVFKAKMDRTDHKRVAKILVSEGFVSGRKRIGGSKNPARVFLIPLHWTENVSSVPSRVGSENGDGTGLDTEN